MARKLRFNIICSGESVRTIEELRENFSVKDVLELYNSGRLERWLDVQGYSGEKQKVSEMTAQGSLNIVKQLVSILGVSIEEQELKDQIYKEEHPVPSIEEILQADQEEGKALLEQLSKNGDAQLWYQIAERYDAGDGVEEDTEQAIFWYTKAAEQGHAEAQFLIGKKYAAGDGVLQDYSKAKLWYEKAAAQGNEKAENNIGVMYCEGNGVSQDNSQAIRWFQKAAEHGSIPAQYNLGNMYFRGCGVPQDSSKAAYWYQKAAEQGYAKAKERLEEMQRKKSERISQQTPENDIVYKYRRAAEQGDIAAQYQLGLMYKMGAYGLTPDKGTAKYWLGKAAATGHTWAMNELKKL